MTKTQTHEVLAYLGDAAGDVTAEQVETLRRVFDRIPADNAYAGSAAAEMLLGDLTMDQMVSDLAAARAAYDAALGRAAGVMLLMDEQGVSPTEIAKALGVTRPTVYKRLGR